MMTKHKRKMQKPENYPTEKRLIHFIAAEVDRQGHMLDEIYAFLQSSEGKRKVQEVKAMPALLDMLSAIDQAPQTLTEIRSALSEQGATEVQLRSDTQLRVALRTAGWKLPTMPTRTDGKVGRWWVPPQA